VEDDAAKSTAANHIQFGSTVQLVRDNVAVCTIKKLSMMSDLAGTTRS